jgi:hypothetical protein
LLLKPRKTVAGTRNRTRNSFVSLLMKATKLRPDSLQGRCCTYTRAPWFKNQDWPHQMQKQEKGRGVQEMSWAHRSARRLTGQGGQLRALLGFETEQRGQGNGAVGVERTRREALILSTGGERLEGREHAVFLAYPAPSSVLPCRRPPPRRPGAGPLPQCPSAPPHRARTPAWPRRTQRPPHLRAR